MSLSYFNVKKLRRHSKQQDSLEPATTTAPASSSNPAPAAVSTPSQEPAASPVLDEEDEAFMARLAAITDEPEGEKPPLPNRPVVILDGGEKKVGKDAQEALMAGADKVPLPLSPTEVIIDEDKTLDKAVDDAVENVPTQKKEKGGVMSYFALAQNKFKRGTDKYKEEAKEKKAAKFTEKERKAAADDLLAAAESSKSPEQTAEAKEQEDLTNILDQLNLSAVNNRVFSFSKESEELMNKFKLVLKDIVNGVPTAYDDLEKLLTGSEEQLQKMFGALPPFLQTMVKSLPAKMTAALGPELLAAQADKPGFDAKQYAKTSAKNYVKKQAKIPSLKSLVSAQGAVATMLRSILNFLKLRFPLAITGTNVLMSLAVFLLLFVFWYCHKRGREVRLEKEKLAAEGDPALDSSASFTDDGGSIIEEGESSNKNAQQTEKEKEKALPPLILHDDKEATVDDMPSVSHLPDPNSAPLPATQQKEEPLKVPVRK